MTTDPVADAQQNEPIRIAALLSQPARARHEKTGEIGFAIIVEVDDGKRVLLFLPEAIADELEHALHFGHVPPTVERNPVDLYRSESISGW